MLVPVAVRAAPVVTHAWQSNRQIAAVAIDDHRRVFAVDENTYGPLVLRAYRPDGTLRWSRTWRVRDGALSANDVALGPGGIVLVSGRVSPDPSLGCSEIWSHGWAIAVFDRDGRLLWHRTQPGWRTCEATATSGGAIAGGGDTIAMVARQADEYSSRARILAFDLDGRLRWRTAFRQPGSGDQWVTDLAVGASSGIYVSGTFNVQTLDSPPTDQDAVLLKLRADGGRAWRRALPDPPHRDDRSGGLTLVDGTVIVGWIAQRQGVDRGHVAAYSFDGARWWRREIPRVVQSGWGDLSLATWRHGPVLATTQRDADEHGTHVLLRAWDEDGGPRWTRLLRHRPDRSTVATGLAASRAAIVVVGRPPGQAGDWSQVWVLGG
jgi:hypothetical protein